VQCCVAATTTTTTTAIDLSAVKALAPNIRHSESKMDIVAPGPSDNLNKRGPLPEFMRQVYLRIMFLVAFDAFIRRLVSVPGRLLLTETAYTDKGSWVLDCYFEMAFKLFVKSLLNLSGQRLLCGPTDISKGLVGRISDIIPQCLPLAGNFRDVSLSSLFVPMVDIVAGRVQDIALLVAPVDVKIGRRQQVRFIRFFRFFF
jgi:hypothetical protein